MPRHSGSRFQKKSNDDTLPLPRLVPNDSESRSVRCCGSVYRMRKHSQSANLAICQMQILFPIDTVLMEHGPIPRDLQSRKTGNSTTKGNARRGRVSVDARVSASLCASVIDGLRLSSIIAYRRT
jgi:hypothetical protein